MYVPICGSCSFIRSFDFITFPSFLLEGEGGEGICSPLIMTRSLYLVMFEYTGERIQSLVWWIPAGVTEQMFDKPFFLSFFFFGLYLTKNTRRRWNSFSLVWLSLFSFYVCPAIKLSVWLCHDWRVTLTWSHTCPFPTTETVKWEPRIISDDVDFRRPWETTSF